MRKPIHILIKEGIEESYMETASINDIKNIMRICRYKYGINLTEDDLDAELEKYMNSI